MQFYQHGFHSLLDGTLKVETLGPNIGIDTCGKNYCPGRTSIVKVFWVCAAQDVVLHRWTPHPRALHLQYSRVYI